MAGLFGRDTAGASTLRSSLLLRPPRGAGDEVLRSFGEQLELGPRYAAHLRCEVRIGESLAQRRDGELMVRTVEVRRCNLQAGIAEEAMDDFAHRLAQLEEIHERSVALGG